MARIRAASLENDRVMEDPETLASGYGWRRAWALRVGFFDGLLAPRGWTSPRVFFVVALLAARGVDRRHLPAMVWNITVWFDHL
jgi:hypothetical protein